MSVKTPGCFTPKRPGCFRVKHGDVLGQNIRVFWVYSRNVKGAKSLCKGNKVPDYCMLGFVILSGRSFLHSW